MIIRDERKPIEYNALESPDLIIKRSYNLIWTGKAGEVWITVYARCIRARDIYYQVRILEHQRVNNRMKVTQSHFHNYLDYVADVQQLVRGLIRTNRWQTIPVSEMVDWLDSSYYWQKP